MGSFVSGLLNETVPPPPPPHRGPQGHLPATPFSRMCFWPLPPGGAVSPCTCTRSGYSDSVRFLLCGWTGRVLGAECLVPSAWCFFNSLLATLPSLLSCINFRFGPGSATKNTVESLMGIVSKTGLIWGNVSVCRAELYYPWTWDLFYLFMSSLNSLRKV